MLIHLANPFTSSSLSEITEEQVQPNAVDLRVDQIRTMNDSIFQIDEEDKIHRGSTQVIPDDDGYFNLEDGTYEIIMEGIITIGSDEAGWVITRSTLNRNGCFITSGLYDSGYSGVMAGALHVRGGKTRIKQGTRVGQFLLFKAEALNQYDGDYGLAGDHDNVYKANNQMDLF